MEPSQAGLLRAQRVVLLACAAAVTLAAWIWLAGGSVSLLPGHQHHHAGWRAFASLAWMWQVMMVAMMTPAAVEWLLAYAALARRGLQSAAAFAAGYFVVWSGYSMVAAGAQMALTHAGFLADGRLPGQAGGAVLIAAGLLYFTPFQRACLTQCRNPLTHFLARWKNGPPGGFRLGIAHGAYCVGCCWMLMLTAFAMGVMNVLWMAVLTLLISVEKLAARGEHIGAVAAAGMTIAGLVLLF